MTGANAIATPIYTLDVISFLETLDWRRFFARPCSRLIPVDTLNVPSLLGDLSMTRHSTARASQ